MSKKNVFWVYGQKTKLARIVGIDVSTLWEVLNRRRNVSLQRAKALEAASAVVLGTPISWTDWIQNKTTLHPAFSFISKKRK